MKSMKKLLLLAKLEVTPGTDSVPIANTNAVLVRNFTPSLIDAEFVQRNLVRTYKGNSGSLTVGEHRRFQFEVELAGSGTVGTAPAWGVLLKACGFAETITAGTDVVYNVVSEGEPTVTLYGFVDGILMKLKQGKGTCSFTMDAKGIPIIKFDFIGEYSAPTDVTQPSGADVDYSRFKQPVTVGKVNTPTFSFHGVTACMASFMVDVANALIWRELVNCSGPRSPDRQPKGTTNIELTSIATKNWAESIRTSAIGAAQIVHGTVAGNIVQIDLPTTQINSASIADQDSIAMLNLGFDINPNTGNDEIVVTVK